MKKAKKVQSQVQVRKPNVRIVHLAKLVGGYIAMYIKKAPQLSSHAVM